MFKKFLIIVLSMTSVIGGISIKGFPLFHKTRTTIKQSQVSNIKEKHIKNAETEVQSTYKNDTDKELNLLSDEKENSQNDNNIVKKQDSVSSKIEKATSGNNINKQPDTSSQLSEASTDDLGNMDTTSKVETAVFHYDRTTSIYANDNTTLLRVEYYVNNKLAYYSVVEQFDAITKSYIEKIYKCNRETNVDPLIRTDIYSNGILIKSY